MDVLPRKVRAGADVLVHNELPATDLVSAGRDELLCEAIKSLTLEKCFSYLRLKPVVEPGLQGSGSAT